MRASWQPSGFVVIGDKSLETACFGPEPDKAPTLVLLHEGLGCVALWQDFPKKLAQATGLGVFVYSRAGYGQSDPADLPRPLNYMTLEAEHVVPEILDRIGFQRGILIGHSDGATIAAIYAGIGDDDRLKGTVLMAPHFFAEKMGLDEIAKARTSYETGDLRERLAKYHRNPDIAFKGWNDSWLHADFKAWNVAGVLDHVQIPVLAIQGREDPYGTLAQLAVIEDRSKALVETLVLEDCRHSPFLDQEAPVLEAISRFCKERDLYETTQLWPSHAYVPGKTPRHEAGSFDVIRQTVKVGMPVEAALGSQAFEVGMTYLEAGFYWEAHEVLEPVWMALPEASAEREGIRGIIQLANAFLKVEMDRPKAALRLCGIAEAHFNKALASEGAKLQVDSFVKQAAKLRKRLACVVL